MSKKLTKEIVCKRIKEKHGDKYDTKNVEYVNNHTPISLICRKHGKFTILPSSVFKGCGCTMCANEKIANERKMTQEEFKGRIKEIHGDKFSFEKTKYVNLMTPCIITCKKHGEIKVLPSNLISGHGCKQCAVEEQSQKRIIPFEIIVKKFVQVHGIKYEYFQDTYTKTHEPMKMKCPKHGEFWQTPTNHLQGQGCPICKESVLEKMIRNLLEKNNIEFQSQYPLKRQRLDFYLPQYNIAIECQGEQHFRSKFDFGSRKSGRENLKECIERDFKKQKECKKQGIKLLYFSCENYINEIEKKEVLKHLYKDGISINLDDIMNKIKLFTS